MNSKFLSAWNFSESVTKHSKYGHIEQKRKCTSNGGGGGFDLCSKVEVIVKVSPENPQAVLPLDTLPLCIFVYLSLWRVEKMEGERLASGREKIKC